VPALQVHKTGDLQLARDREKEVPQLREDVQRDQGEQDAEHTHQKEEPLRTMPKMRIGRHTEQGDDLQGKTKGGVQGLRRDVLRRTSRSGTRRNTKRTVDRSQTNVPTMQSMWKQERHGTKHRLQETPFQMQRLRKTVCGTIRRTDESCNGSQIAGNRKNNRNMRSLRLTQHNTERIDAGRMQTVQMPGLQKDIGGQDTDGEAKKENGHRQRRKKRDTRQADRRHSTKNSRQHMQ